MDASLKMMWMDMFLLQPHLLLLGHLPGRRGGEIRWGVPGGMRNGPEGRWTNAIREFGEETGVLSTAATQQDIKDFVQNFQMAVLQSNGVIVDGIRGGANGYTTITVVIDSPAAFESKVGISRVLAAQWQGVYENRYGLASHLSAMLSSETQGLLWVPIGPGGRPQMTNHLTIAAAGNALGDDITARRGVFGRGSAKAWNTFLANE